MGIVIGAVKVVKVRKDMPEIFSELRFIALHIFSFVNAEKLSFWTNSISQCMLCKL